MGRYAALLRGINVGGNNLIKMLDLKACFENQGFTEVVTLIQSGNVVFSAGNTAAARLARRIEAMLSETFNYRATLVLRSGKQIAEIVASAPRGFGAAPAKYRYDVIYLREPVSAAAALGSVATNPAVDEVRAGPGVLYFWRLIEKASQSRLSKIVSSPIYPNITIRNWNTTTKLLRMMSGAR